MGNRKHEIGAALTVDQAAARLGVTARRVRAMIAAGRLPATRVGPIWLISPADLARLGPRKPGRPARRK